MKRYFYLSALTFLLATIGHRALAQTYNGDLTLTTQAQVDAFNYTQVAGNLTIIANPSNAITNLSGLSGLTSIGGYLLIQNNAALTSLSGLDTLTSIGEYLDIRNNAALTSLSGLDTLTSIGGFLWIRSNAALTSLSGLDALTSIGGYLYINNNAALTSLSGLDALTSIGEYLDIRNNAALTSLSGLSGLTSIGEYLYILGNPALTSLSGLDALTSIGGYLRIRNNAALTSLSGLDALTSIGEYLYILSNAALTSLSGLDALTSIGGYLLIQNNAALTSLSGLDALTSIGEYLGILSNAALTSLSGLDNIDPTTITNLYLQNSSNLSTCEVQSICDYLAVPTNPATISGNATNCASRAAVEAACLAVLPVELIDFKANLQDNKTVHLTWRTASEINNDRFEIEESQNGRDFQKIGEVRGKGTTLEQQLYSYEVKNPRNGIAYYRLKQIDFDGQFEYSQVRSVNVQLEDEGIGEFYPNPSQSGVVNLDYFAQSDDEITVSVFDMAGKLMVNKIQQITRGDNKLSFDFSDLNTGIYIVKIGDEINSTNRKLIIER